jgi:hypothetical protein
VKLLHCPRCGGSSTLFGGRVGTLSKKVVATGVQSKEVRAMKLPDYVHCIAETHQNRIGLSLCGRKIGSFDLVPYVDPVSGSTDPDHMIKKLVVSEFVFLDVSHWLNHTNGNNYLLLCPDCSKVVLKMIEKGTYRRGR